MVLSDAQLFFQDALQQNFKPPEKPWFDFGAGVNLELDDGQLTPSVRLKVKDFFSIKVGHTSPVPFPANSWQKLGLAVEWFSTCFDPLYCCCSTDTRSHLREHAFTHDSFLGSCAIKMHGRSSRLANAPFSWHACPHAALVRETRDRHSCAAPAAANVQNPEAPQTGAIQYGGAAELRAAACKRREPLGSSSTSHVEVSLSHCQPVHSYWGLGGTLPHLGGTLWSKWCGSTDIFDHRAMRGSSMLRPAVIVDNPERLGEWQPVLQKVTCAFMPPVCCCRLDNHMGGLRFGPGGADFDESVLQLGESTSVRAAMSVDFPKT